MESRGVKRTGGWSLLGLVLVGAASASAGCLGQQEDVTGTASGPSEEVTEVKTSGLSACKTCRTADITTYTGTNTITVVGPPVSTHICFATEFQGRSGFLGAWGLVERGDTADGERWLLRGSGKMSCVQQCCFFHSSSSAVRWVSPNFATSLSSGCGLAGRNMFLGDASGWLQGVQLENRPKGLVYVGAIVAPSDWRRIIARNQANCSTSGTVSAWGTSFFVGVAGAGEWSEGTGVGDTTQSNPLIMTPTVQGICYFTSISELAGAGRKVTIQAENDIWVLRATGGARASASCMYYRQTPD